MTQKRAAQPIRRPGVPATPRKKLTAGQRVKVWESTDGVCIGCKRAINPRKEAWIAEHVIPLAEGGKDALSNMGPNCAACAKRKTKADKGSIAKAVARKAKDIGAAAPSRNPIPGGKTDDRKRGMDGKMKPREKAGWTDPFPNLPRKRIYKD